MSIKLQIKRILSINIYLKERKMWFINIINHGIKFMYYLKLFDEDLISFEMSNDFGLKISNIHVLSNNKKIFPIVLKAEIME